MTRLFSRGWVIAALIGAVVLLMWSLFPGSRLMVVLRVAVGFATLVMLVMLHRANQAHKRDALKQLDQIARLLPPRRKSSGVDVESSRRVH